MTAYPFSEFDSEPASRCDVARATLDLARPDDDDAPGVEQALRHVAECPACRYAVAQARRLDVRLGALCRDVSLPAGLKERLVDSLAAAQTSAEPVSGPSGPGLRAPARASVPRSRRKWILASTVAACALVASATWFTFDRLVSRADLHELTLRAVSEAVTPASAPDLPQQEATPLPETMITRSIRSRAHRLPESNATVYFFRAPANRGVPIEGRLVIVPAARLSNPPAAARFMTGPAVYLQGFCTTAWVEGDWAYVCCVRGGEDALAWLRPIIWPS